MGGFSRREAGGFPVTDTGISRCRGVPTTSHLGCIGVSALKGYAVGDEILPVSPARGGATFEVSAVETDILFDDDLGWDSFDYHTGPGSYVLARIVVDLS